MPMDHQLLRNAAIVQRTSQITGSTAAFNDAGFNRAGYAGVAFLFGWSGNISTGAPTLVIQHCSSSGFSTGSDVASLTTTVTLTTAIADGVTYIEVAAPSNPWVRAVFTKTSTADLLEFIIPLGYRPIHAAVTHSTADVLAGVYHV